MYSREMLSVLWQAVCAGKEIARYDSVQYMQEEAEQDMTVCAGEECEGYDGGYVQRAEWRV